MRSGDLLSAIQINAVPSAIVGKFVDLSETAHTGGRRLSINVRATRRDERKTATAGEPHTGDPVNPTRMWIEVMT
jgi:hypothetical protein